MIDDRPKGPTASRSDWWQQETIAQDHAARTAYLEQLFAHPFLQDIAARTLEILTITPGQAVLEVGCGSGVFLPLLAREVGATGRVVGLDYAATLVAEAQDRVATAGLGDIVTVEECDAYHLPYPDNSFDAAHCERVLMHLEDPTAVLREMARVVRPGGLVVAVEPDWAGIRIDHPDQEGFDLLYRRALGMRQPTMGLTLYRRFAEAGLRDRRTALVSTFLTDIAVLRAFGLNLDPAADGLVAEGVLEHDQLLAMLAYLEEASSDGRFFSYLTALIVAGRVSE